jgi:hypothetical protein
MMMRIFLLIAVVAAIATAVVLNQRRHANRALAHQEARTRSDLMIISQALNRIAIEDAAALSVSSLSNLNSGRLYQLLSQTNSGQRFLEPRYDWDSSRQILDRWGRPLLVKVEFPVIATNNSNGELVATVQVWSTGPNARNEGGDGDDISEIIQITLRDQNKLPAD